MQTQRLPRAKWTKLARSDMVNFDDMAVDLVMEAIERGALGRISSKGHVILRAPDGVSTASVSRKCNGATYNNMRAQVLKLFPSETAVEAAFRKAELAKKKEESTTKMEPAEAAAQVYNQEKQKQHSSLPDPADNRELNPRPDWTPLADNSGYDLIPDDQMVSPREFVDLLNKYQLHRNRKGQRSTAKTVLVHNWIRHAPILDPFPHEIAPDGRHGLVSAYRIPLKKAIRWWDRMDGRKLATKQGAAARGAEATAKAVEVEAAKPKPKPKPKPKSQYGEFETMTYDELLEAVRSISEIINPTMHKSFTRLVNENAELAQQLEEAKAEAAACRTHAEELQENFDSLAEMAHEYSTKKRH